MEKHKFRFDIDVNEECHTIQAVPDDSGKLTLYFGVEDGDFIFRNFTDLEIKFFHDELGKYLEARATQNIDANIKALHDKLPLNTPKLSDYKNIDAIATITLG